MKIAYVISFLLLILSVKSPVQAVLYSDTADFLNTRTITTVYDEIYTLKLDKIKKEISITEPQLEQLEALYRERKLTKINLNTGKFYLLEVR